MLGEFILNWWPVILGFFSIFVWAIRLEAKVYRNTEELKRVEQRFVDQRKEDMEQRQLQFNDVNSSLKIIQEDIKILLRSHGKD